MNRLCLVSIVRFDVGETLDQTPYLRGIDNRPLRSSVGPSEMCLFDALNRGEALGISMPGVLANRRWYFNPLVGGDGAEWYRGPNPPQTHASRRCLAGCTAANERFTGRERPPLRSERAVTAESGVGAFEGPGLEELELRLGEAALGRAGRSVAPHWQSVRWRHHEGRIVPARALDHTLVN